MLVLWFIKASLLRREASIYTIYSNTQCFTTLCCYFRILFWKSYVHAWISAIMYIHIFEVPEWSAHNQAAFTNEFLMLRRSFHDKRYKWPSFTWSPMHPSTSTIWYHTCFAIIKPFPSHKTAHKNLRCRCL